MRAKSSFWLPVLITFIVASTGYSIASHFQSGSKNESGSKVKLEMKVSVEGELKVKEDSSASTNSVSKFAFKVSRAVTEDSHELTELRDQIVNLLDNSKSKDLIKKHNDGDKLIIRGGLYLQDKVLIVRAFKKAESEGSGSKKQGSGRK